MEKYFFAAPSNGEDDKSEDNTPVLSSSGKTLDTNVEMIKAEDEKSVICSTCKRTYKSQLAYTRHINSCKMLHNQCSMCSTQFSSNKELKEHIIESHEDKLFVNTKTATLLMLQRKG